MINQLPKTTLLTCLCISVFILISFFNLAPKLEQNITLSHEIKNKQDLIQQLTEQTSQPLSKTPTISAQELLQQTLGSLSIESWEEKEEYYLTLRGQFKETILWLERYSQSNAPLQITSLRIQAGQPLTIYCQLRKQLP